MQACVLQRPFLVRGEFASRVASLANQRASPIRVLFCPRRSRLISNLTFLTQDFEFSLESLDRFLVRCQPGDALTWKGQGAMLPGHLDPAPQRRLADSQVMRDALIGVSWLLGELYGLLLELGL